MIAAISGRLLPLWMFVNQLCLLCHTQYFKTNMPGFVGFYLTELLAIPRFNLLPLWRSRTAVHLGFSNIVSGSHNEFFEAHDYDSVYVMANLAHILFIYVPLIALLWILAFIKDMYVKRKNHDNNLQHKHIRSIFMLVHHEPWMHNFTNRFIYETFFEACLCSMISLANIDAMKSYGDTIISIILLSGISLFFLYVVRLYWTGIFDHTRLKLPDLKEFACDMDEFNCTLPKFPAKQKKEEDESSYEISS